jgi:hypothetical protein
MFTVIVTVLAVMAAIGFLFRIAESITTDSGTISRNPARSVTASRALRPVNTPHLPVDPRAVR